MSIEKSLHAEIVSEFEEVKTMEVGSEKHKIAVDSLAKLMDRAIELEKIDAESIERDKDREAEAKFKEKQLEEDQKSRRVRDGLTFAGIILPLGATIWGTLKSLKFEETGTVTTMAGRNFISRLFSKK